MLSGFRHLVGRLGLRGALNWYAQSWRISHGTADQIIELVPRGANHSVFARVASSDLDVFRQVFIDQEYALLDRCDVTGIVIDCGANVGYTSTWILSRFPKARILAVEPDPGNLAILERNLAVYGDRVSVIHGAVWSEDGFVDLASARFRDGRDWSRGVVPSGAGTIRAFSVDSLIEQAGGGRVSLLKMDIEGAETLLFSSQHKSWVDKIDSLAIEIHVDSPFGDPTALIASTMQVAGFVAISAGETTLYTRKEAGTPELTASQIARA